MKPEKNFFDESEFYSNLKQKTVIKSDYGSPKFLFMKLKMRNLNDMNNLYNAQDLILLLEVAESRFEIMYQKHYYNPRKCSSSSTLSDSIQRDLSKSIIVLPTSSAHMEISEKTLTGGFSGGKSRLVFDIEIYYQI